MICIFRRTRRSFEPRRRVMSWPSNTMLPAVTGSSAVTSRASVDLPQPDSPTRTSVSPRLISRSTPSTARTASPPKPLMGKCLNAPLIRTRTGSARTAATGVRSAACIALYFQNRRLELGGRVLGEGTRLSRLDALLRDVPHEDPAARNLVHPHLAERGLRVCLALVDHKGTARVEFAPWRRVRQVGWQAPDRDQPVLTRFIDPRHRAEQRPCVWVLGAVEDLLDRPLFHDPARVH